MGRNTKNRDRHILKSQTASSSTNATNASTIPIFPHIVQKEELTSEVLEADQIVLLDVSGTLLSMSKVSFVTCD